MRPLEDLGELQQIAFDNACIRCQYCVDKKCWNKTDCFWFDKANKLKALDIIKEKDVFVWGFRNRHNEVKNGELTYDFYLKHCGYYHSGSNWKKLTEQEFDLLKAVLK